MAGAPVAFAQNREARAPRRRPRARRQTGIQTRLLLRQRAQKSSATSCRRARGEVLDVGCGHGITGGLLRSERGIEVVGIEIHEQTAQIAREHLDEVWVGDIETMDLFRRTRLLRLPPVGDVLEQFFVNPWQTLKKLTACLKPRGAIVASIPNIRNLGVVRKVLEGSWAYRSGAFSIRLTSASSPTKTCSPSSNRRESKSSSPKSCAIRSSNSR